jgi:hypothetical protein
MLASLPSGPRPAVLLPCRKVLQAYSIGYQEERFPVHFTWLGGWSQFIGFASRESRPAFSARVRTGSQTKCVQTTQCCMGAGQVVEVAIRTLLTLPIDHRWITDGDHAIVFTIADLLRVKWQTALKRRPTMFSLFSPRGLLSADHTLFSSSSKRRFNLANKTDISPPSFATDDRRKPFLAPFQFRRKLLALYSPLALVGTSSPSRSTRNARCRSNGLLMSKTESRQRGRPMPTVDDKVPVNFLLGCYSSGDGTM